MNTEEKLKIWLDLREALARANSQVAAAAELYLRKAEPLEALAKFSERAQTAERLCNEAERLYRKGEP